MCDQNESINISVPFADRQGRWRMLLLAASGLMTGLTVAFPQIGMLEWVAILPALWVLYGIVDAEAEGSRMTLRRCYAYGLLFYGGFYLVTFHWFLAMYPLEFTGISRGAAVFVVLFAWWGLSLFQALGAAFVFPAFVWLCRRPVLQRYRCLRTVLPAALWVLLEWGQTLFWTGVPWARLALGQTLIPAMLGTASLLGSYIITFSLVLFNGVLAYAVRYGNRIRACALSCAVILAFVAGGGVALTVATRRTDGGPTLRVAAVQGNLGSADKWDLEISDMFVHYYELTEQAAASGVDLIVWPETAVPATLLRSPYYTSRLSQLAKDYQTTLLIGLFTENENEEKYNSMVVFRPDGTLGDTVYSKRHLVPFGEYVPMEPLIRTLLSPLASLMQTHILPGEDAAVFDERVGRIGSLICFDSIYEMLALESVREGAELLTVSTNDSWFFDSVAARMHNGQAQLRAVETGRWVVRAASTGISSIIAPTGEVMALQEALSEGILYGMVSLRQEQTLYCRVGNLFVVACALACGSLAAWQPKKKNRTELR